MAALITFVGLFFLQNVFGMIVARPQPYVVSEAVLERLSKEGVASMSLEELKGTRYPDARAFIRALEEGTDLDGSETNTVLAFAERDSFYVDPQLMGRLDPLVLSEEQIRAVESLSYRAFGHDWQFLERLAIDSPEWKELLEERPEVDRPFAVRHVLDTFRVDLSESARPGSGIGGR
jgi:hypothetical protein